MKTNLLHLIFAFIIIFGFASCFSYRKVIKEPLKVYGTDYLIEQMKEKEFKSKYFTARFSAEIIRNRKGMSFSGQLRMKKDSIIWLSLSPALGLEMGRLIITTDSVKWMNRLESNYMLAETDHLSKMIHPLLDYDLLQSLILGNDLTLYDNSIFKGSIDSREYKLSVTHRRKLKKQGREDESIKNIPMQHIWLDPETFRITKVLIKDFQDKDARIDASFQRFDEVDGYWFAARRQYNIEGNRNKLKMKITFSRPDTPEACSFSFTVPEKYNPIEN